MNLIIIRHLVKTELNAICKICEKYNICFTTTKTQKRYNIIADFNKVEDKKDMNKLLSIVGQHRVKVEKY